WRVTAKRATAPRPPGTIREIFPDCCARAASGHPAADERSLLRRSRLPDQRKSRNWHPEILSKHAALQPTRSFALSRASKSALIIFIEPSILTYRFSKYAIDHLDSNPIRFFKAGRIFLRHFPVGRRD